MRIRRKALPVTLGELVMEIEVHNDPGKIKRDRKLKNWYHCISPFSIWGRTEDLRRIAEAMLSHCDKVEKGAYSHIDVPIRVRIPPYNKVLFRHPCDDGKHVLEIWGD